ncbi:MAG: MFS transporter [Desulfobacteraceae bacterium]|nr:MAG: MFS transporter [Desulfobacteraceae bacterium]
MNIPFINILMALLILFFAIVLTSTSPLLIEITKTFQLSLAQSGTVFTLSFSGFVLFIFIGGFLSDFFGKKKVLGIALFGYAVSLVLIVLAPNYLVFSLLIFFSGGCGGVVEVLANSIVGEINTRNKTYHINLLQVFFGIGAVIGPVLSALIVTHEISWKIWYLICGILCFLLLLILAYMKMDLKKSDEGIHFSEVKDLIKDIKFVFIILCMFLYTGSEIGAWGWMSTFLKNNLDFTILEGSLAVALFWSAMTIGRFVMGLAILKYKNSALVILLSFLSSALILISMIFTHTLMMWISIFLMGLFFSSIWPLVLSYGGEYKNSSSATLFSILVGAGGIGATVIPFLMGISAEQFGSRFPMTLPLFCLLLVGFIFTLFKKQDRNR